MKFSNFSSRLSLLIAVAVVLASGCEKEDPCTQFSKETFYVSGNFNGNSFTPMTKTDNDKYEFVISKLAGDTLRFIIANSADGKNATWGDVATATGNSGRFGIAEKKVESEGKIACGNNRPFTLNDAALKGKKIVIKFNLATEEYELVVTETDECLLVNKSRMWVYWRTVDADAGSFGFQEMAQTSPGVFEITRTNFQPCCGAWAFKFVNTPNFTSADWGREVGFTPTGNFDPLNRKAGRKVITPILENGIKVGETLICGGNVDLRIPTAGMAGKNIRLIFDSNKEEYTWIAQ